MPVRRVVANDQVQADRDRVALQRGPIVYAAEWPDNPNGKVRNIVLPDDDALTTEFRPSTAERRAVVRGTSKSLSLDANGKVVRRRQPFMAIPYCAWANRGRGQMAVWLPRDRCESPRPRPLPTLAMRSKVTTSRQSHLSETIINDGEEPRARRPAGRRSTGGR